MGLGSEESVWENPVIGNSVTDIEKGEVEVTKSAVQSVRLASLNLFQQLTFEQTGGCDRSETTMAYANRVAIIAGGLGE